MENLNNETKKQKKFEFNGNWMIAFFVMMLVSVVIMGKCTL